MLGQVEEAGLIRPRAWRAALAAAALVGLIASTGAGPKAPVRTATLADVRAEMAARRGAPLLVNFWASWCAPCLAEMPDLGRVESRFSAHRVKVLGVSVDLFVSDDGAPLRSRIAELLDRSKVRYTNLLYTGTQDPLAQAFGLLGVLPSSILYGPDGKEIRRWVGPVTLDEIDSALASPRKGGPKAASPTPAAGTGRSQGVG
jgi:thiol-disulfide isomerase/thioredoxin